MAILPDNTDYTDKDFDSLRARLVSLAESVWPDFLDSSSPRKFDVLLMEMFAFVGDVALYYADQSARESRVVTSNQRKNIIALGRNVLYELATASPATVDVTFTLESSPIADVVLPAGTVVRTPDIVTPVEFQLLADLTISAGSNPPEAIGSVENSLTRVQVFTAEGKPDSEITLDFSPYIDDTAIITTSAGGWTQVDTFFESEPGDRHYTVKVDNNDRARIRFGNGTNGAIPDSEITAIYKTGGGEDGNVAANTITVIDGSFTDNEGRTARVSVNNASAASGGAERETIAEAQINIPASLRALTRSVTRDDFEVHARAVPGVARALMLTSDQDTSIAENSGIVFPIPDGGGTPSTALKDDVLTQITETYPPTVTFRVSVQDPIYETINVEARVTFSDGADPVTVREAIKDSLDDLFALNNADGSPNTLLDFGLNLDNLFAWSDVFNAVRDTTGVRRVSSDGLKLNGLIADVQLENREFPALGTVTVINASTGGIV